jgi:membrane protein implicated in regulation of membrane protease activity
MLMPLLALLLFVFLPWQAALALYVPIALVSLAISRQVMRAQSGRPASGAEAMRGDWAVVTRAGEGEAEVHYRGETWHAVSSTPLQPGEQVVIEAVEGLTLRVAPNDGRVPSENGG